MDTGAARMMRRAALLLLPLALYLALPTRNFYWDGVAFAINIEKHSPLPELLHPNHLIYAVAGSWLFRLVTALGIHTRALFLLQAVNSVLAWPAIVIVSRLARPGASVTAALLLAFSATWWKYATDANAYVPAILLILCCYYVLERSSGTVAAALLLAGAMLFHELAILFLPVAIVRLRQPRRIALFVVCSLLPVAAAYVLAYRVVFGTFAAAGFLAWLTSHSPDSGFSTDPLKSVAFTVLGTVRLFFGGKLGELIPGPLSIAGVVGLVAVTVALLLRLRRARLPRPTAPPRHLMLWVAVYLAFLFFWMPQNTFYRLFYLPGLILLVAHVTNRVPALAVAFLALWNFVFFVYPQSRVETNAPLRFALAQHSRWPGGTPIVFSKFHPDLWTISYFNPQASWISLDRFDLARLNHDLEYAHRQNQPLWLEETAYDLVGRDPAGREWLASHASPDLPIVGGDAKHEFRFLPFR